MKPTDLMICIKVQALIEYRSKGLPPGWIKEIRFSKSKKGIRKITVLC